MLGIHHALSGAVAWTAGCALVVESGGHVGFVPWAAGTAACAVGALLPDLDHPRSIASRSLWPVTPALSAGLRALSAVVYRSTCTPRDDQRAERGTHRALTHTALFAAVVGAAAAGLLWWLVPAWWWLGAALGSGCLVHTLGDGCTRSGVPLLWPLSLRGRRWRRVGTPVRFLTGGTFERWVVAPALCVALLVSAWLLLPAR